MEPDGITANLWRRADGLRVDADGCGGQLIHGDAIYPNSRFIDRVMEVGVEDLLKTLLVLSAYRQNDLVLSVLSSNCPASKLFSSEEVRLLEHQLVHYPSRIIRLLRWMLGRINQREKR